MLYNELDPNPTALSAQDLVMVVKPVFDIVGARLERGHDNRFDHFLWDNIHDTARIKSEQGGVTDRGYMLHLQRLSGIDPPAWTLRDIYDDPRAYDIALANLHDNEGNYDGDWGPAFALRAERVESSARHPGHPMMTVYFTDNPLETIPARVVDTSPRVTTIATHLAERALNEEIEAWWANKPRVVLSTHMRRLYLPQQPYETLHPWDLIVSQLGSYGPKIAQMLMAETINLNLVQAS